MLAISNLLYFVGYRILGYRKSVVQTNLKNSFPEKSEAEIKVITKAFYRSFFDFVMETLNLVGITRKELRRKIIFINPEVLEEIPDDQGAIVLGTHLFNWEMYGVATSEYFDRKVIFSYQQLSSRFSDNLMLKTRSKFGAEGVLRHETAKAVIGGRKGKNAFYVLADQAPVGKAMRYWSPFLNQDTSFYHGIGKVAKMAQTPVLIVLPRKVKRGYYEIEFKWVAKDLDGLEGEDILDRYIAILQDEIRERPSEWLWTHKRWKNRRNEGDIIAKGHM